MTLFMNLSGEVVVMRTMTGVVGTSTNQGVASMNISGESNHHVHNNLFTNHKTLARSVFYHDKSVKHSFSLLSPVRINSNVSFVNKPWIRAVINDFMMINYPFLRDYSFELNIVQDYHDNKIISTTAVLKFFNGLIFASGRGVDEYEAVFDLLNNLDLELRFAGQKKPSINDSNYYAVEESFVNHIINNEGGGENA